jgi:phosphatidylinositol dimannoside acyltransferase
VLPCFMERAENGHLTLRIEQPLSLVRPDPSGPTPDEAATTNTARWAERLSAAVVANPSHYLYFLAFRLHMAAGGHETFFADA